MPVWPKTFYTFRISLKTAAMGRTLRRRGRSAADQQRALAGLLPRLAATSHWKQAGIEPGLPYSTFRTRVPLCTYEQLEPAIDRMKHGEPNVLWPGQCALFARTAGTSTGSPKYLPVTEDVLAHFRRAAADALLYYTARATHAGAFHGRHLVLGSTAELVPLNDANPPTAFAGEMSGIAALNLPPWVEQHLYEKVTVPTPVSDLSSQLNQVRTQLAVRDVTLIAGLPNWTAVLGSALREKSSAGLNRVSHLQEQWPNLECFVHAGVPIAPYASELRELLGPGLTFHEVYAATEGFFAAQDAEPAAGLRVMANLGVFFEFLPMAEYDETRLEHLGPKAISLEMVKTGIDYAAIITSAAGLVRYVLGDVVRFISTDPPRLIYVGGTRLRLNAFGENVTEREATDALVAICRRRSWAIVNFHIAPLFSPGSLARQQRGRHEWWVELHPGTVATPTGPQLAIDLDAEIQASNPGYASRRQTRTMDAPIVRLVMPGVFEHWLRFRQQWVGQHKMPRCRSDRLVAEELAAITNFAVD